MSNALDQEENKENSWKRKRKVKIHETKNDIQGRCRWKKYGNSEGGGNTEFYRSHQQGNPSKVSLLLKGEIILCLYLHVFIWLLYFFVSLIGNLDQNNDIFA